MNREEQVKKNLELAHAELLGLLDTPADAWPRNGDVVVYAPSDDPELTEANLAAMRTMQARDPNRGYEFSEYVAWREALRGEHCDGSKEPKARAVR